MLWEELKKIWIKQRVLFVLSLLFAVQAGYVGCRGLYSQKAAKAVERNETIYEQFYSQLEGRWDPGKDALLDEWLRERDESQARYNTLVDQLLTGDISEEVLYTYYHGTPFCQNRYTDVLEELDQQRNYVKQDTGKRYMMKGNGWVYYFEDHFLYYLYFVFLLVLFIPLFIREKETGMDLLQGLSAKGQKRIFDHKILAAFTVMGSGLLLLTGEKFVLYSVRCGLDNMMYPIQSLPVFETCPWNIPVVGGLMAELLLLLCAGVLLGGVTVACSMFIPRTIDVCLIVLILVFVPMFLFSKDFLFHYPILTSLLYPDQLVYGWRDIDIGEQVYKTGREIGWIGAGSLLAGMVLFGIAKIRGRRCA